MTWIIAILLALILVALMQSNQGAALAVNKVIKYALLFAFIFLIWSLFLGVLLWSNSLNNDSTWSLVISAALGVIVPPAIVWTNYRKIRASFEADRKAATKKTLKVLGYIAFGLAVMVTFQYLKKEEFDVIVLLAILVLSGSVLVSRSLAKPQSVREIWLGLKQPEDVWQAMDDARAEARAKEDAIWDVESENWESKSEAERDALRAAYAERAKENEAKIQQLESSYEEQYIAWSKQSLWTFRNLFWIVSFTLLMHVAGTVWDTAYEFVVAMPVIAGRGWLATTMIVLGVIVIVWVVAGVIDAVNNQLGKKAVKD
ncbi:hypothetical protein [Limnohabitans sp. T6-20]|uniref:hypothetical protein n=1 Tax=Limnohabitans sp. T6-20 TaxID=1100725 RepID=UPI000D3A5812|nr:hypothetical protein [Limnohabitans sp. T6-20]PUE08064.1 hypothetical protein B9Z33_14135 [Limnohabitans sp. T6-20]